MYKVLIFNGGRHCYVNVNTFLYTEQIPYHYHYQYH